MLATFANTVVSALASADTLTAPSDLGRWGTEQSSSGGPNASSFLSSSQAVALVIILIGAILTTLTERGKLPYRLYIMITVRSRVQPPISGKCDPDETDNFQTQLRT